MSLRSINHLTVVGDASGPGTWSGIPVHFWQAAQKAGWTLEPWRLELEPFRWPRRWWNLAQTLRGRGPGGFQYSAAFLNRAEAAIPAELWPGRVLSFSQHFPRARSVAARGGQLLHYIDATLASFCAPGGLEARLPARVRAEACRLERENFAGSERVVTMARWAAESAVYLCGVSRARLATILPGANVDLPADYAFPVPSGRPGSDRPLVLGFVGKDWRRKGLPFLLAVRAELERRGVRAEVHCAGHGPADLGRQAGVVFTGFIDKAREPGRFLEFLTGCDLGCLFSTHEPLGISTLEFLRAGVPVCGFAVEGLADTLPPDAGFRFAPHATASEVAETLQAAYRDDAVVERLRSAAQVWSPLVTWERCIGEWTELLEHGCIAHPVQPWRGIAPRGNPRRDLSRLDPSGLGGAVATFSSESGTQTDHEN